MPSEASNQERILSAARQLFLEKGFNGSNLRDISRVSQVSMGGIYHHFSSKEEIYTSLFQGSDVTADMLSVLSLLRSDAFPDNLAEVGAAVAEMVRQHRDTFKLFYIDVLEFEGRHVKPLIQRFREGFTEMGASLLEPRRDALIDIHPALVIRVLIDVFVHSRLEDVMLDQPMADALGMSEAEMNQQIAELLLRGLIKRT